MTLEAFIRDLPKAELHVHHVGSASLPIVAELAARHPGTVPADPEALRAFYEFRDFAHFIEVYLAVVDLIRTPDDVRYLTYEVARELAEGQSVRYAELTCTPYTSVQAGVAIEGYTEAIEDARVAAERDFGIVLRWIYDIPGESGVPAADVTLGYALDHAPDGLVGFGLGGPEVGVPRAAVPAALRRRPRRRPALGAPRRRDHRPRDRVGRAPPARCRADRPRHLRGHRPHPPHPPGRAADPARGVPDLQHRHPRRRLARRAPAAVFADAGVVVTVNSDDPPMFGTTLNDEYAVAARLLDLDEAGLAALATVAIDCSFAPDDVRARVRHEIAEYATR